MSAQAEQNSAGANYALGVLLSAYILSFIDRNVMAVLIGPIRADFSISDFEYSLLHGFAFSMFYIFLGLPIARLADRHNRRLIITSGIFLWSLATAACGLTRSFTTLFLARMTVGVGEAALSPPAFSLLSDYFSADRLPRAMAIYTLGITIGGGLAYILGGALFQYFASIEPLELPGIGTVRPWQMTFFVVGAPGILVAFMMLLSREPRRAGVRDVQGFIVEGSIMAGSHGVLGQLRTHASAYASLILGVSLLSVLGYGTMAWYAEYLIRIHGMARSEAGSLFGIIFIVAGSLGTLLGGWSPGWLRQRGYADANLRWVMLVPLFWVVPAVAGPLASDVNWAIVMSVPSVFFLNSYFAASISALQLITPNQLRAQISAIMLFSTNLFGLAIGPTVVAALTDFVFQDDQALPYSLAIMSAIACPFAALLLKAGLAPYRRAQLAFENNGNLATS